MKMKPQPVMSWRIVIAIGVLAVVTMLSARVREAAAQPSQPSERATMAKHLWTECRSLMDDEATLEAACARCEESLQLKRTIGTLLNLALCYEKRGKLASAWTYYREAAESAARTGDDREQGANERAHALEPRLPKLSIRAPHAIPGQVITRDGAEVEEASLGIPVPVDPGSHEISATAPTYRQYRVSVDAVEGQVSVIEIPELEPMEEAKTEPAAIGPAIMQDFENGSASSTRGRAGLIVMGGGAVLIGTSIGLRLIAGRDYDHAFASGQCDQVSLECTEEGQKITEGALLKANIATVAGVAGMGVLAAGLWFYLSRPSTSGQAAQRSAHMRGLVPYIGSDAIGLAVIGEL